MIKYRFYCSRCKKIFPQAVKAGENNVLTYIKLENITGK